MAGVAAIQKDVFTEEELLFLIQNEKVPHNAISWAAENGYLELVKMLIDAGAEITENGNYPLELASRNGHTEIVKILLDAGATTKDSEEEGYCLRLAADRGHIAIVNLLLNAGANPLADHYFALKRALNMQHMEVVEVLLDAILEKRKIRYLDM